MVREGQLEGVYMVLDGRARLRWVRLGRSWGEKVEVLSGLEAGAQVVAEGMEELRDGRRVEVRGDA